MMGIVTGRNRESPLGFRANPQIRGARRLYRRVTASHCNGIAPSNTMAMRRRRIRAEYAVIAALISTAWTVVGAAQLPVTTSNMIATPAASQKSAADGIFAADHYGQCRSVSSEPGTVRTALIRPAPLGEMITPDPPDIPAPTLKPLEPPVAAPPPQAQQPQAPPRQQEKPPPPQVVPPPQVGPAPGEVAPPSPPPPQPAPQKPPRGHVQLSP
jgi:hypothetical protein